MSTYNNDPRQTIWELWFVSSIIILVAYIFIGTLPNIGKVFPSLHIWSLFALINFILSLICGCKK